MTCQDYALKIKTVKELSLSQTDPLCLVLSADFRLCNPNFFDDQTWRLNLGGGEPPALSFSTSFGLRARVMRLYPRFVRPAADLTDPASFHQPIIVKAVLPNYCRLQYWPFAGIEVNAEYLVAASNLVSGRIQFINRNILTEKFHFEWVGQMIPLAIGEGIQLSQRAGQTLMVGTCENLNILCGSDHKVHPGSGPFPALAMEIHLPPANQTEFSWKVTTQTGNPEEISQKNVFFHALVGRSLLINDSECVEVDTGDQSWDAALAFSQENSYRLFFPGSQYLPNPSFVLWRDMDAGYSPRGDGSDHPYLWHGQTIFDSYHLAGLVLPGGADYLRGVVENFLHIQMEDGRIDCRPGLAGTLSRRMAQPMLASLAWKIYKAKPDPAWLAGIFPGLRRFFLSWMNEEQDRDQDGLPEWSHPLESALEDNPLYDRHNPQTAGWDIKHLESPVLGAMLFREVNSLLNIARRININDSQTELEVFRAQISRELGELWNKKAGMHHYRDGTSRLEGTGKRIAILKGCGKTTTIKKLDAPSRLILKMVKGNEATRAGVVHINGYDQAGKEISEELPPRSWIWARANGSAITTYVYAHVTSAGCTGFEPDDEITISGAECGAEDISLLLGLWGGSVDEKQANHLVKHTIPLRFLQPFGIVDFPANKDRPTQDHLWRISLPWNSLILEGYLAYGFRAEAAAIFSANMKAVITSLKSEKVFSQYYHPESGIDLGQHNHMHGLPSMDLFLKIAGIEQITETEIFTRDFNGFPFPVTVKYHGITITSKSDVIEAAFPNGQLARVDSPGFHRISLA